MFKTNDKDTRTTLCRSHFFNKVPGLRQFEQVFLCWEDSKFEFAAKYVSFSWAFTIHFGNYAPTYFELLVEISKYSSKWLTSSESALQIHWQYNVLKTLCFDEGVGFTALTFIKQFNKSFIKQDFCTHNQS